MNIYGDKRPYTECVNLDLGIIKNKADVLNINYDTLLELSLNKIDRNEVEHDSIKSIFRNHSHDNVSFRSYLQSFGIIDKFNTIMKNSV
jgi:hypothetical protein